MRVTEKVLKAFLKCSPSTVITSASQSYSLVASRLISKKISKNQKKLTKQREKKASVGDNYRHWVVVFDKWSASPGKKSEEEQESLLDSTFDVVEKGQERRDVEVVLGNYDDWMEF